jgi:hypothetical protein
MSRHQLEKRLEVLEREQRPRMITTITEFTEAVALGRKVELSPELQELVQMTVKRRHDRRG